MVGFQPLNCSSILFVCRSCAGVYVCEKEFDEYLGNVEREFQVELIFTT